MPMPMPIPIAMPQGLETTKTAVHRIALIDELSAVEALSDHFWPLFMHATSAGGRTVCFMF